MKELVDAHEELKQQKLKVKERIRADNKAVEELIRTDLRIECVRKHKDKTRQMKRKQQLQQQQQLACDDLDEEHTSP